MALREKRWLEEDLDKVNSLLEENRSKLLVGNRKLEQMQAKYNELKERFDAFKRNCTCHRCLDPLSNFCQAESMHCSSSKLDDRKDSSLTISELSQKQAELILKQGQQISNLQDCVEQLSDSNTSVKEWFEVKFDISLFKLSMATASRVPTQFVPALIPQSNTSQFTNSAPPQFSSSVYRVYDNSLLQRVPLYYTYPNIATPYTSVCFALPPCAVQVARQHYSYQTQPVAMPTASNLSNPLTYYTVPPPETIHGAFQAPHMQSVVNGTSYGLPNPRLGYITSPQVVLMPQETKFLPPTNFLPKPGRIIPSKSTGEICDDRRFSLNCTSLLEIVQSEPCVEVRSNRPYNLNSTLQRPPGKQNSKYKTKPCTNFSKNGSCPYGDRCQFIHDG
uniref:C3H1-type domain-containing protein n=1 Tax=Syphacia muris TaxID=451379 RepID=A0A0N5AM32_9BILA